MAPITDTPHALIGDMQREALHTLDLAGCNVAYIHKRLDEYEAKQSGLGHRFETWPPSVRHVIEQEIEAWTARNPEAMVKAVTTGVHDGAANLALHWRPRNWTRPPAAETRR